MQVETSRPPGRDRSPVVDRRLRAGVALLVSVVALVAFVTSFRAVHAFAVAVGTFPARLEWLAPVLVYAVIVAGSLAAARRVRARQSATFSVALAFGGVAVAVVLTLAHAPDRPMARLAACMPFAAFLLCLQLLLEELAAPGIPEPTVTLRPPAWPPWTERERQPEPVGSITARPDGNGPRVEPLAEVAHDAPASIRERVLALAEEATERGQRPDAAAIAKAVGVTDRWVRKLLAEPRN